MTFITQLRLDASLYDFPQIQQSKKRGRPRIVGERLKNLEVLAKDKEQKWIRRTLPWYSGKSKDLDFMTGTCLWYHNTVGGVPIRWILTKDPSGVNSPLAILATDLNISAEQAIAFFVGRWPIETTFQEINHHFGLETIHTWSDISVNRTAPIIIASYTMACLMANQSVKDTGIEISPVKTAWYNKEVITFSDVMVYIKFAILNKKYFSQSKKRHMCEKIDMENLYRLWAIA